MFAEERPALRPLPQTRMGHSTILMTMRYSHLAPEQHRLFVDRG